MGSIQENVSKGFDDLRQEHDGVEFRSAREVQSLFGYKYRKDFVKVIEKAEQSLETLGELPSSHVTGVRKSVTIGSSLASRVVEDYDFLLTRYACYLVAQNGSPKLKEIAEAQSYFALQTRKREVYQKMQEDNERLEVRSEVTEQNKKLMSVAQMKGIKNFGSFNDFGYRGLYGMRYKEIEKLKGLGKDKLLDRANITELAANLFRITQTEEKLRKESEVNQHQAENIHFMIGGKIRQTIKDIGGEMPENIPPVEHIKEVQKRMIKRKKILGKDEEEFLK